MFVYIIKEMWWSSHSQLHLHLLPFPALLTVKSTTSRVHTPPMLASPPLFAHQAVTEPPKIIPYYRLSRSTWPLSNNKELLSRFRRVKPGKSHTTGSLICAKPTRRRDQSTTLHYIKGSQVQHYYKPGFPYMKVKVIQSLNSGK
jgi:hypothetical protein